ncbi:adenylate/guanylate cyclase domain-containing protein [Enterovirga aerilata]|uniref:Adenylate/guanylate cyclase domain-containing protein n=1 Tax=Enterovirga aerilata TaxID=2730920 RepID=A0A849IE22_9HYPH|nr:adenylate/guanylate cyclase domain-containing protein [Enterovirga sp. DB1703]NNM74227.1 adenylate/guanylate cyclase domain-containing protein [Enterovirga sp. DB1703]
MMGARTTPDDGREPDAISTTPTLVPRLVVLVILLASATLDGGLRHGISHWLIVGAYALGTALVFLQRTSLGAWTVTVLDGLFAGYVLGEHVFVATDATRSAAHTATLVPAFLLLLASGLTLAPVRTATFAALVVVAWTGSLGLAWALHAASYAVIGQHLFGLLSFVAASGFVLHGTARLNAAVRTSLRAERERAFLSRFVPSDTRPGENVARRHVALLAIDIRGFSDLSRKHPAHDVMTWLLQVRALVNAAVGAAGGSVDKYVGDGVLAHFSAGSPPEQAEAAMASVREIRARAAEMNLFRREQGLPEIRLVAALHAGTVLAGILDDGFRAEMTVLGPAMNALARIERRAKLENLDIVSSARFATLLAPSSTNGLVAEPLLRRSDEAGVPDLVCLSPVAAGDCSVNTKAPEKAQAA